jgi:hypothetical protein
MALGAALGGRLFNRRLQVPKLQEFEDDFFMVLEKVQTTTTLFPDDISVRDECGIARTIWRTLTAHACNMGISIKLLKAINCWRSEYSSKTGNPRMDMPDVYTMLESLLPSHLQFSLVL